GTVQQHTEDAFLASRADQRCKKETYERPPAGVLEFNLQILHRAFRLQLLKEDGPFLPGLPEAEIDSSFSDDMVRRQFQELQQVFIYVEEYSPREIMAQLMGLCRYMVENRSSECRKAISPSLRSVI